MELLLGTKSLPPGFRFHPTDEELFMYHLKRKVLGKKLRHEVIAEVDVYRFEPWDLPSMASLKSRDLNWYFFCPRGRKYPNGGRANRATEYGYWKSTGNDRTMMYNSRPVGKIKTLVFHRGKPPKGEMTDWVMHEYMLEDEDLAQKGVSQESYVICKIYEKSGLGPKNGENYGARFVEEEWDSDDENNVLEGGLESVPVNLGPGVGNGCVGDSPDGSISGLTSVVASPNVAPPITFPTAIAAVPDANATFPNATGALFTACGNPNIIDASPGTACAFTPSTRSPSTVTSVAAGALDEDDLKRMLSCFTDELDNGSDFFKDLEDLGIPSGQVILDWNDIIELDDLN